MDGNPKRETGDIQSIDGFSSASERPAPNSIDAIMSAVANEHRRAILNALDSVPNDTLGHEALVTKVADQVRDDDTNQVSDGHRQRVRIALHHTHLPKLEAAQMIDYEADTGRVQFVGGALEREILTLVEPYDNPE